MARHDRANSTSSSSSSESSAGSSTSEGSTLPSTPLPRMSGKRGRDASDKNGLKSKKTSPVRTEKKAEKTQRRSRTKVLTPREQCIHVARWIPRGLDMFCDLKQAIQVSLLLEQEEAAEAEDGDETEEEHIKAARRKILDTCDNITRARYKRTFEYVMEHAPYLGTLIGRRKKREELAQLIGEMQNMINHTRSEDASRLKSRMGSYAAPNPDKELIRPPITDDSKSRAQMGFNHTQLGKLLCPVKYLVDYIQDPHGMKNKFDSASLKVTAALWPAFLYPGNTAGEDFDPEDIIEGLFRGYLLERVTKHIFTSPSSALKAGISSGTRACNAKLHGMKEVGAEHIAYAAVQARFAISSLEKWKDHDGLFYYTDFYTRIVNLIRGRKDEGWVNSLLGHYNEKLFGNENGAKPCDSANAECSEDDDMIAMERQLAARAARASRSSETVSAQSSALDRQQESRHKSLPPPDRSPTPDPPIAQALANPREDKQPSPLPPSSPQQLVRSPTPDPPVDSRKAQEVLPARPPTPNPPDNSHKRKQVSASALFDDNSPLTEEDEEITRPTKRKRKNAAVPPKKTPKRKAKK
ncbi:hypothetical protein DEU56DRAFT_755365 [Suillus clintonianus]|uniref:uncharacterized protein n=1 Tax=Suillus clintonianus TaxID=1904413 RepID=UPI001B87E8CA|nr:uncharacterized protein DEU56DRAFT_756389 [Suillus clintonianus]XP_041209413.1 uncharacterized protein DEU56DRAFT_755365 [Suillus clintonianus]KAG2135979.1 hypothetical protein DEU56DRAFT_756389 [Suillus clintonianus]KAG2140143.1 hypothetical protein DEU56DRAFT_755365 [Suillus clintonianus]